ncbi:DUF559 domain-containing protein [Leifsonia sp. RAF41]|uniref:endonuclease domain-containing protein n=1 Tax=Leifsonia sp. RAF41 TaxID=3233056 RepID=UPI003F99B868
MQEIGLGTHFTTSAAQQAGASRSRLRRSDLVAPHHGVRATQSPDDVVSRCRAFLPAMSSRMVFSHVTAAQLHGLPLPRDVLRNDDLHVSARAPTRAPRHRGVRGHQAHLGDGDVVFVHGLPVVTPVESWCQLASTLDEGALVVYGDALVRRKSPLATVNELAAAVNAGPGRPGVPRLRRALAQVRSRTDSPLETILRLAIIRAGLPEPLVNYQILTGEGEVVAHGDLVYPQARVVIEYDGDHHRTDARQYHLDVDRLWKIQSLGWKVVRINSTHLASDAAEAVRRIRLAFSV